MVRIIKVGSRFTSCFLSGLLIGILLTVTGFMVLFSYRIDSYHQRIKHLEASIQEKDISLSRLEESMNKNKLILKEIQVFLSGSEDELDNLMLQKHIKEKYSILLGKEVNDIDMDMAVEIIDKRIFKLEDQEYQLRLARLALSDVLKLWVEIKKLD